LQPIGFEEFSNVFTKMKKIHNIIKNKWKTTH
jgi:hypothetical protein